MAGYYFTFAYQSYLANEIIRLDVTQSKQQINALNNKTNYTQSALEKQHELA